jgi:uncharacterized protein (DUF305 family)
MKKIYVLLFAIAFTVSCQQTSTVSNSNAVNNSTMNPNAMTSGASQMNHNAMMNQNAPMNHDHSKMQTSGDAKNAPYDLQFLDTMIEHHQAAVDMAKMVGGKTENAELEKFAEQIIVDQNKEINQMKQWREKWFTGKPSAMNMEMPGMKESMDMDMGKLAIAQGEDFDAAFVEMMIPHHQGAVTMSQEALQKAEHGEIKTLAEQIIRAQQNEIKMMRGWNGKWAK